MRDDQHKFLMLLGQLPARLTAEQAAWVLNCQPHDVPASVAAKLLKPLGNPPANGIKFFATEIRRDNWKCNPAQAQGEVVQPFQKLVNRNLVLLEHGKEIIGGRFQKFLVPQSVKAR